MAPGESLRVDDQPHGGQRDERPHDRTLKPFKAKVELDVLAVELGAAVARNWAGCGVSVLGRIAALLAALLASVDLKAQLAQLREM